MIVVNERSQGNPRWGYTLTLAAELASGVSSNVLVERARFELAPAPVAVLRYTTAPNWTDYRTATQFRHYTPLENVEHCQRVFYVPR